MDKELENNWRNLLWANKGLRYLPDAPYPITSVNALFLNDNKLTKVDGLSNITNATNIYLHANQLTNVNGLSNLTSAHNIYLDKTYSGPKLSANTRFCAYNPDSVFPVGYAQKSQLCESP